MYDDENMDDEDENEDEGLTITMMMMSAQICPRPTQESNE